MHQLAIALKRKGYAVTGSDDEIFEPARSNLAAEGLLERSIGRGTYVKGSVPAAERGEKWLLVCDPDEVQHPVLQGLMRINGEAQIAHDVRNARPSFINQFTAVVDFPTPPLPDAMSNGRVFEPGSLKGTVRPSACPWAWP